MERWAWGLGVMLHGVGCTTLTEYLATVFQGRRFLNQAQGRGYPPWSKQGEAFSLACSLGAK